MLCMIPWIEGYGMLRLAVNKGLLTMLHFFNNLSLDPGSYPGSTCIRETSCDVSYIIRREQ